MVKYNTNINIQYSYGLRLRRGYPYKRSNINTIKTFIRLGSNLNYQCNLGNIILIYLLLNYQPIKKIENIILYSILIVRNIITIYMIYHSDLNNAKKPSLLDIIKSKIIQFPNLLDKKNESGRTILMDVCYSNICIETKLDIVSYLISCNADLNLTDSNENYTALMFACIDPNEGNDLIVKMLLGAGADPDILNINGETALMIACKYTNNINCINIIELLIKSNCNINQVDYQNNNTALTVICQCKNVFISNRILELLIKSNADINHKIYNGMTPVMIASTSFNFFCENIVDTLVNNGANIQDVDLDGNNALMLVCNLQKCVIQTKIAKKLIDNGIHVNVRNNMKQSALMLACLNPNYNIDMIRLLIDAGADYVAINNTEIKALIKNF